MGDPLAYRKTARVREKLDRVRSRLLREALAIVAEGGFAALRVADLAERAEVATGTVYRHFPNKSALAVEVFAHASEHEVARVREALEGDGNPIELLASAIALWCDRAQRGRVLARALIHEPVDPAVAAERTRFRAAYAAGFAEVLDRGIAEGVLPAQDTQVVASCIVGALAEAVLGPLDHPPGPASNETISRFCLAAIRPGDPS